MNSDGAPIYENSTKSIWPIFLKINELNVSEDDKIFLYGCHIGTKKPDVKLYLHNLVIELNKLYDNGLRVKNEIIYPVLLNGLFDTPARSHFLNHSAHNGRFGCTMCKIKGRTYFFKSNRNQVRRKHKMIFMPTSTRSYKSKALYNNFNSKQLPYYGLLGIDFYIIKLQFINFLIE